MWKQNSDVVMEESRAALAALGIEVEPARVSVTVTP